MPLDFEHLVIPVRGMSCASCASRIEKKVAGLDGVKVVLVNFGAEQASVDYDPNKISSVMISDAIEKIGFKVLKKQKPGRNGEIHITDSIKALILSQNKFIGHIFRGKYLDCGSMSGYINSTLEISKL